MKEQSDVEAVTSFLVQTCEKAGGDLLVIAHVLDAFFDIFSENYYDGTLSKFEVVKLMKASESGLLNLY